MSKRIPYVKPTVTALAEHTKEKNSPSFGPSYTENDIIDRIRIGTFVSLGRARKLIKAARRKKCLEIIIGIPPGSPRGEDECSLSPNYFYEGSDLMKLEPLILHNHTMLNCSATLCWGDGGQDIDSDEFADESLKIINENYREPTLCLYF